MSTRPVRRRLVLAFVVAVLIAVLAGPAAGISDGTIATDPTAVASDSGAVAVAGSEAQSPAFVAVQPGEPTVSAVTIDETPVEVGETTTVRALVENNAGEPVEFEATLTVDGSTYDTQTTEIGRAFDIVEFEVTLDESGTYPVSVNGVEADRQLRIEQNTGGTDGDGEGSDQSDDNGDEATGEDERTNITVDSVNLTPQVVTAGETVRVRANLTNSAPETGTVEIDLEVDGEVVDTASVEVLGEEEFPGVVSPHTFEYEPGETGTYTVSVSGVEASEQLLVKEATDDGGGLFGFLGFLPLGIIRPVLLFIGLPLLLIYLGLKAMAIYLGY